jgi:hypothetical protein
MAETAGQTYFSSPAIIEGEIMLSKEYRCISRKDRGIFFCLDCQKVGCCSGEREVMCPWCGNRYTVVGPIDRLITVGRRQLC